MNAWQDELRQPRDVVTLPTLWVAVLLSVVIHGAALWGWKQKLPESKTQPGDTMQKFRLRLAPAPRQAMPPPPPPSASAAPGPRQPKAASRARNQPQPPPRLPERQSAPPVVASNLPPPAMPLPAPSLPVAPPVAAPARPPSLQGDMLSFIEARRRERAAALGRDANPAPVEDENARRNRIAAANIAAPNSQVFGYDPRKGGGVFQIETMSYDYAEFLFLGWDKDIGRKASQRIEVRKGGNSDIHIAVVRRMIAIIREHEQGDFVWHSNRLGRDLTLSARSADNAGLEEVLFREFFGDRSLPSLP